MTGARNVLFLLTDQQRVDTLGVYGTPWAGTPVLDDVSSTGTRFDRWYTPTAICTPARVSLLTGQAPFRHRVLANHERNVGSVEDLPEGQWTFPEALRQAGYACGLVGKWHAGTRRTAASFGFDGSDLPGWHNPVQAPDYLAYLDEHGFPPYEISDRIRGTLPNGGPGNLLAARLHQPVEATFEHYLATRAIEMLERYAAGDRPFFLGLHFFGPHLPYILPDEYVDLAGVDPSPAVDSRSLLPLVAGEDVPWAPDIVAEFHGHHFPYPQRMLRTDRYKLVVNPESVNELYDLADDPDELLNVYELPELAGVRTAMLHRLYTLLRERGDNFHHWMTSMYDVGEVGDDPTLSGLDETTCRLRAHL